MHIDLNSCFAIIEQQANPLYRNKPVAIAAYDSPGGAVIASSYEAKALGIKLGVSVREAKLLCPGVIVLTPDAHKYREAHKLFKQVLLNYTNEITPKSIDEFIIDFKGSQALQRGRDMQDIGRDIKLEIKKSLGSYVTVNVGIGTNRFWAKTAAGLNKPDGLDIMTADNATNIYETMKLTDITGINVRFEARLNAAGIHTPLQFLSAGSGNLKKRVFHSKLGFDWYCRLRGWEVDEVVWGRKSFGHTYALGDRTTDRQKISRLLMKLCEKTGRRLRGHGYAAGGIYLSMLFEGRTYWAKGRKTKSEVYSTQDIFLHAQRLLNQATIPARVTNLAVSVYDLTPIKPHQSSLFEGSRLDNRAVADACDDINDKFGEFVITPALMMGMQNLILDRVAFGSTNS
jgi:DNA polymerase-4